MKKVAILVDGGFYRKVAAHLFGKRSAQDRAEELVKYCFCHLKYETDRAFFYNGKLVSAVKELYRIYYYDCPPISKTIYHPLRKNIDMSKNEVYKWTSEFFSELKKKRKVALRLGTLADSDASFVLKGDSSKKLLNGTLKLEELKDADFELSVRQKGVDMKIGIDIATLAYKRLVDQIVLISGDSDFVPAAKLARREGVDFVLDSMGTRITDELLEHIDGLQSYYKDKSLFLKGYEEVSGRA